MPSTTDVESLLFRHLTGRAQPRIPHPTSNAFDLALWQEIAPGDVATARDWTLARTAALINQQVRALRDHYIAKLFEGMSAAEVVMLAIASANRGFLIIREKMHAAIAEFKDDSKVAYLSALSQIAITTHEGGTPQVSSDINTAIIDTLPHWFAAAAQLTATDEGADRDFGPPSAAAQAILSMENSFREVWQEVLWEPWAIEITDEAVRVFPINPKDQAMWRIWDWREQAILHQSAVLNRHLERRYPDVPVEHPLAVTVSAYTPGAVPAIALSQPTAEQSMLHRSTLDLVEDAYVSVFLDQPLNAVGLTPRLLVRASLLLQDLLAAALPHDADPDKPDRAWVERMACRMPRTSIISAVENALGLTPVVAEATVQFLTSDPHGPLGPLFTTGIWHRPLVASQDGADLMLVAGALVWGSPLRAVERWLQAGQGTDLSKTTNGLIFEQNVRDRLVAAIAGNPLLTGAASNVRSIPGGGGKEEIDLVFRLGASIVVGEIKCFLGPADPIERYDYLRKLEDAASQARRKAAWLADHLDVIADLLPESDAKLKLRLVPLVITNQSNGASWSFEGCPVTDAHWLELFLSTGEYNAGAAVSFDGSRDAAFVRRTLYQSAEEAEKVIPAVFEKHPGVASFIEALDWSESQIPLCDGRPLLMAYPIMNPHRYMATFSVPATVAQPDD